jgi:voltage-gated potassium channel
LASHEEAAVGFTLEFLQFFITGLTYASPLVFTLLLTIVLLGMLVGRTERWSRSDAIYYAFITATTVGYGDFRPSGIPGKVTAIGIALVGLILTGIIVSIGVDSAARAFEVVHRSA